MNCSDLKSVLNECKAGQGYTKITDLREDTRYRIMKLERVNTPFGETVMATLEGLVGDEFFLKVYLPRRYNDVLSERMIEGYNAGVGERLHLVKRAPPPGSKSTPLEFV